MQQMCGVYGKLESSGIGLHFDNLTEQVDDYTFAEGMIALPVSMLVFLLMGFYLDKVLPKKYGETRSPLFCFSKRFCCSCCDSAGQD